MPTPIQEYMELAQFGLTAENKRRPNAESLKMVSLDKGGTEPGLDSTTFVFYITVFSTRHGKATYLERVVEGIGGRYLESFTQVW
ncbi:unnamed protein product [Linum trigynum]|uniref:Uncharacterized protein n=1 Tax=Linum trigynum TaxID=586398 RepID=A0AAV2FFQ6_9ROSI